MPLRLTLQSVFRIAPRPFEIRLAFDLWESYKSEKYGSEPLAVQCGSWRFIEIPREYEVVQVRLPLWLKRLRWLEFTAPVTLGGVVDKIVEDWERARIGTETDIERETQITYFPSA